MGETPIPASIIMPVTINDGVSRYELVLTGWKDIAGLRTSPRGDTPEWAPFALSLVGGGAAFLDGTFLFYVWDSTSVAADDGINVIKPTAITGAGRWRVMVAAGAGIIIPGMSGNGSPNGVVVGSPGNLYVDLLTGDLYKKITGVATNTGWM